MKLKLLLAFVVLAICVCPVLSVTQRARQAHLRGEDTIYFPGGDLLLLPNDQFLWEASDVSGLFPSLVSEAEIQSVINAPAGLDAKTTLTIYTKDGHYYLVILGDAATKALARGLQHGGFGQ